MVRAAAFFGLVGLALAIGLVVWQGYDQVLAAFAAAGWGILLANLFHIVPLVVASYAWILLWPGRRRPSLGFMTYVMWVRAGVNNLLPVARIGGEVVAARLLIKHGWRRAPTIASVVVETTVSVVTVFLFIISGIVLLTLHDPTTSVMTRLVVGALVSLPVIILLVLLQRYGAFSLLSRLAHRMVGERWRPLMRDTARLDRAVLTMYRRTGPLLVSGFWMFVAWALGAVEIWIAAQFLGQPLSLLDSLIIEAMIQLASSAAFIMPAALGVQEGAFLFFGAMLGLPPDKALALALIRRCRDLILYVPALIVWSLQEGKGLLALRRQVAS
jgi:glycosyltransferase 2 family protein